MKNWRRSCMLSVLFVLLLLELGPRIIGLVSFPIYELDPDYKYVVKPNQHGAFLNYNDWVINSARMPIAAEFTSSEHPNALLIGNSIVFDGNPYKQSEKLTPLLQQALGENSACLAYSRRGLDAGERDSLSQKISRPTQ